MRRYVKVKEQSFGLHLILYFIHFSLRSVDEECGSAAMLADTMLEEVHLSKSLGIHLD